LKISIITVCLNSATTIQDTVRSVVAQDWHDLEHIVIDGGSTDGTLEILQRLQHDRLRVYTGPDEGMYDAMNQGIKHAVGEYVGFLNADDFFASENSIRLVASYLLDSKIDCVLGSVQFVDRDGAVGRGRRYSTRSFRPWWLRIGVMPPHPGFYIRTSLARSLGGFDITYRIAADFDLIARVILKHRAQWVALPSPIVCFREGGLTTRSLRIKWEIGKEIKRSLRALGQLFPAVMATLRYPFKLAQFATFKRRTPA
jgi:glycosyltransferase involved in cell wall biosynthesis